MNSERFHNAIQAMCKAELSKWDFNTNPLAWEGIPQAALDLIVAILEDALKQSRKGVFGAPFHLDCGRFDKGKHFPNPDAVIKVEIIPLDDGDDYAGASFNLADSIIKDAESGDGAWTVGHAIRQLEGTIAKLQSEGAKRGWDLSCDPS